MSRATDRAKHKCPHPLCDRNVSAQYLACRAHWAQLPRALREAIYATVTADRAAYHEHVAEARAIWAEKARAAQAKGPKP